MRKAIGRANALRVLKLLKLLTDKPHQFTKKELAEEFDRHPDT